MLLFEYTANAATTASYPRAVATYCTVEALVGEIAECVEAKHDTGELLAEAGDVLWQLAMANRELGLGLEVELAARPQLGAATAVDAAVDDLVVSGGYFLSRHAKRLRDGHGSVSDEVLRGALSKVLEDLHVLVAGPLGHGLDEVAAANLAKLASRAERGVLAGDGNHR